MEGWYKSPPKWVRAVGIEGCKVLPTDEGEAHVQLARKAVEPDRTVLKIPFP
jgi:hypothetical protein